MTHTFPSPLLVVEASSGAGSVALLIDDVVVADRSVVMGPSRDDALLPAIDAVLRDAQIAPRDIRAVACGSGPGSFTSLRIAASLAKGIVVANAASLYAIPSLLLAAAVLTSQPGRYVLHADALRSERYVLRADITIDGKMESSYARRMVLDDIVAMAADEHATLVAIGGASASPHDALVLQPHARNVALLGAMWHAFGPVPVGSWEPDYGRLAEAQVKWESAHGRVLPAT